MSVAYDLTDAQLQWTHKPTHTLHPLT